MLPLLLGCKVCQKCQICIRDPGKTTTTLSDLATTTIPCADIKGQTQLAKVESQCCITWANWTTWIIVDFMYYFTEWVLKPANQQLCECNIHPSSFFGISVMIKSSKQKSYPSLWSRISCRVRAFSSLHSANWLWRSAVKAAFLLLGNVAWNSVNAGELKKTIFISVALTSIYRNWHLSKVVIEYKVSELFTPFTALQKSDHVLSVIFFCLMAERS